MVAANGSGHGAAGHTQPSRHSRSDGNTCIGALSFWCASEIGNAANQSFASKDLTADILPPPLVPYRDAMGAFASH